jgi:hypothetical protein
MYTEISCSKKSIEPSIMLLYRLIFCFYNFLVQVGYNGNKVNKEIKVQ